MDELLPRAQTLANCAPDSDVYLHVPESTPHLGVRLAVPGGAKIGT